MPADPKPPLSVQLARASWVAPLLLLGAGYLLRQAGKTGSSAQVMATVLSVLAAVLILIGIGSGILALFGISRHGRKGILVPALVGILLSSAFLVALGTSFWSAFREATDPQARIEAIARELRSQGLPLKVDDETELMAVTALPGQLVYDYRLVKYTSDQLDARKFHAALLPELKKRLCPRLEVLWKNRFSCKIRYADSSSAPITEVLLTAEECSR